MKSRELIRLLQEEDPTGETEVCVGNVDIFSVHTEPAYYDGRLQLLVRDESKKPYYDVVGGKYCTSGLKVVVTPLSITDVLWDDPDATVDYSELGESTVAHYKESDDQTRQASRDVTLKVEMEHFQHWVKKKADEIRPGGAGEDYYQSIKTTANYFFEKNLHADDPLKDIPPKKEISKGKDGDKEYLSWPSFNDRREAMWDDALEVFWRGGWGIRKKDGSGMVSD